MVKAGYPRNDIFFKKRLPESDNIHGYEASEIMESKDSRIKPDKKLRLVEERTRKKKVLLYAPTWRDDEYLGNGFYKCPSRPDFIKLQKELEDEYIIIVKLHYLVKLKKGDIPESCIKSGFVRICGNERDIAELYLKADGLITDYSSVFFDYAVTEKPMFFFCYDLEAYRDKLRGFYLDFEKVAPGPISSDEEQLAKDIRDAFGAEREKWQGKIRDFKNWFNTYDDGKAGERVLDVIAERMGF